LQELQLHSVSLTIKSHPKANLEDSSLALKLNISNALLQLAYQDMRGAAGQGLLRSEVCHCGIDRMGGANMRCRHVAHCS
jgi:hypothetical protein